MTNLLNKQTLSIDMGEEIKECEGYRVSATFINSPIEITCNENFDFNPKATIAAINEYYQQYF